MHKKQEAILTAAQKLFYRFGIKKVSIEEICKEAKVSKMTFYKYFPNKIALAKSVLDAVFAVSIDMTHKVLKEDAPFIEKMNKLVQWKINYNKDASMTFIRELYASEDADPEIIGHIRDEIKKNLQRYIEDFVKAQQEGWIRKDIKPQLFIAMLNQMAVLSGDEKVLSAYDSATELISEMSKLFIYGIANER